jgi:hypothetical protein
VSTAQWSRSTWLSTGWAAHSPNKGRLLAARAEDSNATVPRAFLQGAFALSHQVIDLVLKHGQPSPEKAAGLILDFFDAGDATPQPSRDGNASPDGRPQHPRS